MATTVRPFSFAVHESFNFGSLKLPIPFTDSEDELELSKNNEKNSTKTSTAVQNCEPPSKIHSPVKLISSIVITPASNKHPKTENQNPTCEPVTAKSISLKTAENDTPTKKCTELLPRAFSKSDMLDLSRNTDNQNFPNSPRASTSKNVETTYFKNKISPKSYCKTGRLTNCFKTIYKDIMSLTHLKILLTEEERSTLDDFAKLDEQYVFYCLSLFLNLKTWTNVLKYRDKLKLNMTDFAVTNMCKILERRGYFLTNYKEENTRTLLQILELSDVKNICDSLKITIPPRERQLKSGIIHILMDFCKQDSEDSTQDVNDLDAILRKEIYARLGYCVKLSKDLCTALKKLHVLYSFPNEDIKDAHALYEFLEKMDKTELVVPEHYVHKMEPFHSTTEFTE